MKRFKKAWLKVINVVLIVSLSAYVCIFALHKARNYEIYSKPRVDTKIYTIWHIETFEGGSKARVEYLKKIAKIIEKENVGVLCVIRTIKPERLAGEIQADVPDIISFGYGLGKIVLPYLTNFDSTYNVRDELVESGMFNNLICALPYIVSGYAKIKHSELSSEFYCGTNEYTKPENIYSKLNLTPNKTESQFEAYKHFVYNKNAYLLGTARDVYRVNNLNNIGRTNAIIKPVDSYTDLLQYIGLIKVDEITSKYINLIFNKDNQTSLTEYSLFSPLYNKIYNLGIYSDMENAILNCKIPKVFND